MWVLSTDQMCFCLKQISQNMLLSRCLHFLNRTSFDSNTIFSQSLLEFPAWRVALWTFWSITQDFSDIQAILCLWTSSAFCILASQDKMTRLRNLNRQSSWGRRPACRWFEEVRQSAPNYHLQHESLITLNISVRCQCHWYHTNNKCFSTSITRRPHQKGYRHIRSRRCRDSTFNRR